MISDGAGAGDAEVGHARAALVIDQDVVGLEVAVDDPAGMREPHAGQNLADDLDRLGGREASLDQVLERGALDVLHRDPVAALVLAAVVDGDDVRVLKAGGGLRLAAETLDELLVGSEALVEELQGDLTPEHLVVGRPDVGHAARADAAHQAVARSDLKSLFEPHVIPPARP